MLRQDGVFITTKTTTIKNVVFFKALRSSFMTCRLLFVEIGNVGKVFIFEKKNLIFGICEHLHSPKFCMVGRSFHIFYLHESDILNISGL